MLVVVWVYVVDLVDFLSEEACPVQRDVRTGRFQDALQFKQDGVGGEADTDMCLYPVEEPVIHRTDIQVCLAEPEGPLNHKQIAVFLYDPVIRQRAVGRIAFVPVKPGIILDLVVVDSDGGVACHGQEAVVASIVQLVLRESVRHEAFLEPLEAVLAVGCILPCPGVAHRHDHAPAVRESDVGALAAGKAKRGDLLFELLAL